MEQAVLCHEDQLQQRGEIAFGFVRMENGATIFLEAAWALNVKDSREAATTLCGTKAQRTKARSCPQAGIQGDADEDACDQIGRAHV